MLRATMTWEWQQRCWFMADDISPTTKRVDLIWKIDDVHAQTKSHVHELEWMNVTDFHLPILSCCCPWSDAVEKQLIGFGMAACLLACLHTMPCPCEYYLIITWFVWWLVWFHCVEPQNNILFQGFFFFKESYSKVKIMEYMIYLSLDCH